MNFVEDGDRRPLAEVATCRECDNQWFTFSAGESEAGLFLGVVQVNGAGDIIAHSGLLHCNNCGTELDLPQFRLRLVT